MPVEIVPRSVAEKLVPRELDRLLGPSEAGARVLVIDDDPRVASLLGAALEPAGYTVLSATSGQAGIEAATKAAPDAIVLELTMPEMSGFDVLATLRLGHIAPAIPVIVLTAADLTEAQRAELKRDAAALANKGDLSQPALPALLERVIVRADDSAARATGTGPLVLVVDDDDLNRILACSLLERHGYRVLEADNGDAGVTAARQAGPALVLLDLAMPGKNGFVTLAELRGHASTAKIPETLGSATPRISCAFPASSSSLHAISISRSSLAFSRSNFSITRSRPSRTGLRPGAFASWPVDPWARRNLRQSVSCEL